MTFHHFLLYKSADSGPVSSVGRPHVCAGVLSSLQQLKVWVRPVAPCCGFSHLSSCFLSPLWAVLAIKANKILNNIRLLSCCFPGGAGGAAFQTFSLSSYSIKHNHSVRKKISHTRADIMHVLHVGSFLQAGAKSLLWKWFEKNQHLICNLFPSTRPVAAPSLTVPPFSN